MIALIDLLRLVYLLLNKKCDGICYDSNLGTLHLF